MNIYQTVIILNTKMSKIETKAEIKKYNDMLQDWCETKKVKVEDMGVKKLAYAIKGIHTEGYYVLFTFMSHPTHIVELEKQLRIDGQVLKFITVELDGEIKLEDYDPNEESKSEQNATTPVDAMDVLLGLTNYV